MIEHATFDNSLKPHESVIIDVCPRPDGHDRIVQSVVVVDSARKMVRIDRVWSDGESASVIRSGETLHIQFTSESEDQIRLSGMVVMKRIERACDVDPYA
jgi:hypothetical protein